MDFFNLLLDTNVWRRLGHDHNQSLRQLLKEKKVSLFLCETTFTFEGVQKKDRLQFLQDYQNKDFAINAYLKNALESTADLDIKILRTPRIGLPQFDEQSKELISWYKDHDVRERQERMRLIHQSFPNSGFNHFESTIKGLLTNCAPWQSNLDQVDKSKSDCVSKSIAEWCDGDLVAAAYGYKMDAICTMDQAKNAEPYAIFEKKNCDKLMRDFGIPVKSPDELEFFLMALP